MSRRKTFFMWRDETDRSGHARRLGDAGHRLLRDQKSPATPHGVGSVFALLRKVPRPMPSGVERQPAPGSEMCELRSDDVQRRQGEGGVNAQQRNRQADEVRLQQVPQELVASIPSSRLLRSNPNAWHGGGRRSDRQDEAAQARWEAGIADFVRQSRVPVQRLQPRRLVYARGLVLALIAAGITAFVVTQWPAQVQPDAPLHPPGMIYRKARVR